MKDYVDLPGDGENYRTVCVDSLGVARDQDGNVGVLVRPQDEDPFVICVGNEEDFLSLMEYFLRCAKD